MIKNFYLAFYISLIAICSLNLQAVKGYDGYEVMNEHGNGRHSCEKPSKLLTTTQAVNYLVKNLPTLVQASDVGENALKMVLKMHQHVSKHSDLTKAMGADSVEAFYNGNDCYCTTPNFCFFSLQKSFAGKCAKNCCDDKDFSDDTATCACCCYPFCLLPQVLCGWLLPCGYSESSCWALTPYELDKKKVKDYLTLLNNFYIDNAQTILENI